MLQKRVPLTWTKGSDSSYWTWRRSGS